MQVTIMTLYRGKSAETYVAVIQGELTPAQKSNIRDRFEVNEDDDDVLGFVTYQILDNPGGDGFVPEIEMLNAFP